MVIYTEDLYFVLGKRMYCSVIARDILVAFHARQAATLLFSRALPHEIQLSLSPNEDEVTRDESRRYHDAVFRD